jgi:hypothetical protein
MKTLSACCGRTIRVITKLPNSEQSYKGKVKIHKYINRQNQSTTGKLCCTRCSSLFQILNFLWSMHFSDSFFDRSVVHGILT